MRKPLASVCLLLAWLCANGALLDGVQVVAWARMFAGYSQSMGVSAALRATFDPARPCELCLGVAAARETAQQQAPAALERSAEKIVLALHTAPPVVFAARETGWPRTLDATPPLRVDAVPVPPPRV